MRIRRAVTALSVIAAAGIAPLIASAPAQASAADCESYQRQKGGVTVGSVAPPFPRGQLAAGLGPGLAA